jgi:hypothetical protein
MSGSAVLDTALGVIFVLLTTSLICSGAVEWLSNKLGKRGDYLLRGLREMLDVPPAAPTAAVPPPAGKGLLGDGSMRDNLSRMSQASMALADRLLPGTPSVPARVAPEDVDLTADLNHPPLPDPEADPDTGEPVQPAEHPKPWLADLVMAHPVVASLHRPLHPAKPGARSRVGFRRKDMHLTSYLSAQTFARALLDMFVSEGDGATSIERIQARVNALDPAVPGRASLLVLIREAEGDLDRLRRSVEHWYDEQMGRVTGWYKRWAQWRLFIAGGLLAVVANISTAAVAQSFYSDGPVREAVVAQAQSGQLCGGTDGADDLSCERERLGVLRDLSLPVGWDPDQAGADCATGNGGQDCGWAPGPWLSWAGDSLRAAGFDGVLLRLLGWLMTAAAVSFGAPFWFDALGKLGSLRVAGRQPKPVPGS